MKYTVEGYSQREIVRLGLDPGDVIFVRWFIDFYSGGMMKLSIGGKEWGWLSYRHVVEELPVLGIQTNRGLYKRMQRLVEKGVLMHRVDPRRQRALYRPNDEGMRRLVSGTPNLKQVGESEVGTSIRGDIGIENAQVGTFIRGPAKPVANVGTRVPTTSELQFIPRRNSSSDNSSIINSLRPRGREKDLSHPETFLLKTLKSAFAASGADKRLLETGIEAGALQRLCREAEARSPERPETWAKELIAAFVSLKALKDPFWLQVPLLPSWTVKPGIFAQLLDQLSVTRAEQTAAELRAQKEHAVRKYETELRLEVESPEARAEAEAALEALKTRLRKPSTSGGHGGTR